MAPMTTPTAHPAGADQALSIPGPAGMIEAAFDLAEGPAELPGRREG